MKTSLVLLMLCFAMISTVVAQATWVSGYVKDAEEKPIAGAVIRAKGVFETSTTTDANGYYKLGLSAGEWTVTVSYDAYEETKTTVLADGEHKVLDFTVGIHLTTYTQTTSSVTFTGYTTYQPETTITGIATTEPSFNYWWIAALAAVAILGIVAALSTRKRTKPSPEAKVEPPRKEVKPTELPAVEKERRITCSSCGHVNPPYAVNYCVNCGARLK